MNLKTLSEIQKAPLDELFAETVAIRKKTFGDEIELCSIVNVKSGLCSMNCRFCSQSRHYHTSSPVYPLLDAGTLREKTESAWNQGVRRVGWVASGCAVDDEELEHIVRSAAGLNRTGRLCASLGQLSKNALETLRKAGWTRYHHNLETSERFYPEICTTQRWRDRWETVRRAKTTGLEVCCGALFGLGETWADRAALARTLGELQVDSVPINFLNPVAGTPLGNRFSDKKPLSAEEALRIVALFRILLPETAIRICGGRPSTLENRQHELFDAGADALMTGDYLTTPGVFAQKDREMIRDAGLKLSGG